LVPSTNLRGVTPENRNLHVRRRKNNHSHAPIKLAGPSASEHDELSFSRTLLAFFILQFQITQVGNATTAAQENVQCKCGWHTHRIINMHCVQMDRAVAVTPDTRLNGHSAYGQTHTQQKHEELCDMREFERII
jgi:hypothetical protein